MATYRKLHTRVKSSMKTGSDADEFKPDWFVYEQMATFLQSVNFKKNEKFRGKFEYLFFNSIHLSF